MKKRYIIIIILCFLLLAFMLPLAMDRLIIGNSFPSNIENSDWVDFFGGYIGALLGAAMSFVGILITIHYTNAQSQKDRELQVRPYCILRFVNNDKIVGTKNIIGDFSLACDSSEIKGPINKSIIYIKNVGLGPAVEFSVDVEGFEDGRKHYPIICQDYEHDYVNLLQSGEEAAFPINIAFNFDIFSVEDIKDFGQNDDSLARYLANPKVRNKYGDFSIIIFVRYNDMFKNSYIQKITLSCRIGIKKNDNEGTLEYFANIIPLNMTTPEKFTYELFMGDYELLRRKNKKNKHK